MYRGNGCLDNASGHLTVQWQWIHKQDTRPGVDKVKPKVWFKSSLWIDLVGGVALQDLVSAPFPLELIRALNWV